MIIFNFDKIEENNGFIPTEKGLELGVDKVVNETLDALKIFGQGVRIQ